MVVFKIKQMGEQRGNCEENYGSTCSAAVRTQQAVHISEARFPHLSNGNVAPALSSFLLDDWDCQSGWRMRQRSTDFKVL